MQRKKTQFERFFSFNRYRRRFGAGKFTNEVVDFKELKDKQIEGEAGGQTWGSEKSLDRHLFNLRQEFAGQSELIFYHAKLIVLIRRDVDVKRVFETFSQLWLSEADFLCAHLNLRWLVAASDTFADHHPDASLRATAMIASVMVNTVKIYETERKLAGVAPAPVSEENVTRVRQGLVPLFSGLSCFTVGTDDTLRNMRWRLDAHMDNGAVGRILREAYNRLQIEETAFSRLRMSHHRDKTAWWD